MTMISTGIDLLCKRKDNKVVEQILVFRLRVSLNKGRAFVRLLTSLLALVLIFSVARGAFAQLRVGLGEIKLQEELTPGGVHRLPNLPVVNNGEVGVDVDLTVEVPPSTNEEIPLSNSLKRWFRFSPQQFHLEPKQGRSVQLSLFLPFIVPKGIYRVLLEARPISGAGNENIGPTSVTRLIFSVGAAPGIGGAFYQRITTLWNFYQPWTTILALLLDFLLIFLLLRRVVFLEISFRPRWTKSQQEEFDL